MMCLFAADLIGSLMTYFFLQLGTERCGHYPWSTFHIRWTSEQMSGVCQQSGAYHGFHTSPCPQLTVLYVEPRSQKYSDIQPESFRFPNAGMFHFEVCMYSIHISGSSNSKIETKFQNLSKKE